MPTLSAIRNLVPGLSGLTALSQAPAGGAIPGAALTQVPSALPAEVGGATGVPSSSFSDMLGGLVNDVNAKQLQAGQNVAAVQAGDSSSLHRAMIGIEEANVSFQLMVEVRNKLLESYQELMRMQV